MNYFSNYFSSLLLHLKTEHRSLKCLFLLFLQTEDEALLQFSRHFAAIALGGNKPGSAHRRHCSGIQSRKWTGRDNPHANHQPGNIDFRLDRHLALFAALSRPPGIDGPQTSQRLRWHLDRGMVRRWCRHHFTHRTPHDKVSQGRHRDRHLRLRYLIRRRNARFHEPLRRSRRDNSLRHGIVPGSRRSSQRRGRRFVRRVAK